MNERYCISVLFSVSALHFSGRMLELQGLGGTERDRTGTLGIG
jgi:hypothetical protein